MNIYDFLASLPALLGIAGFCIYQLMSSHRGDRSITLKILEKIRINNPEKFEKYSELNSRQLLSVLSKDNNLRKEINVQDFELARQTLKQRFITSIAVYTTCAILFVSSAIIFVYQETRTKPIKIENIRLSSSHPDAKGLAVDLDMLMIQWFSSGEPEDVNIYMENMDSKRRTREFFVHSSERLLTLDVDNYKSIVQNRTFREWNRIRVVIQSENKIFKSAEFKLFIGMEIIGFNHDNEVTIAAMIDNALVQFYNFEARMIVWKNDEFDSVSFGDKITGGKQKYQIENPQDYDWDNAKLVYLGPDDSRLVRTLIWK